MMYELTCCEPGDAVHEVHAVGHGHAEVRPAGAEDQLHPQLRTSCSSSCGGGLQQQAHGLVARGARLRLQRQPQPGQHQRVVEVGPELGQKENVNSYYSGGNRYMYLSGISIRTIVQSCPRNKVQRELCIQLGNVVCRDTGTLHNNLNR